MKQIFLLLTLLLQLYTSNAQTKTHNVVIVTLDGMRWQEVFSGADSTLTFDTTASYSHRQVREKYWAHTSDERRKKLMPFLWSELVSKGLLIGNRALGSKMDNANQYWFSYPGYSELLTGYPDSLINSNDTVQNPNVNVLEFLNSQPAFKGKIAVFGSWDRFSYILNQKRSGLYVNDGFKNADATVSPRMKFLNELQHQSPDLFHGWERLDVFTYHMGMEYMKARKPRIMYFALGDTDEFAHSGKYDYYMDAAHQADAWIGAIWNFIQSTPGYANKTTLLVTTDHGRGSAHGGEWQHHGSGTPGSGEIWLAAIGPSIPANGELRNSGQIFQGQFAATVAQLLGFEFKTPHKILPPMNVTK